VTNDGGMDADAVVEAYMKANGCADVPPNPVLCGYERVHVRAGETVEVTLPICEDAFTCVLSDGSRVSAGRDFTLYLGSGQPDAITEALSKEACVKLDIQR
ncbi:MAG: fibronectin type III-like domain-contianing protein, partial [Clostridia bacterium]|nr:fibronectin type III-like domain-contianing protein [Clostridia bacterium]